MSEEVEVAKFIKNEFSEQAILLALELIRIEEKRKERKKQ